MTRKIVGSYKILSRKWFKLGYEVREELVNHDNSPFKMKSAYTPSGHYIGDSKIANFLTKKKGIRIFDLAKTNNKVISVGFNPEKQIWYGWSHRAICGFKIGDKIFEQEYGNDKTPFRKHGKLIIKTLADAKLSASKFASYVA